MSSPDAPTESVDELLIGFGQALRDATITVGTDDVLTFTTAVAELDVTDLLDVYWSGRATLVRRREQVRQRNSSLVSEQEIETLRTAVASSEGALNVALAQRDAVRARLDVLLPAQRASAMATLAQAEAEISKATVYAGTDGTVKQFKLKRGDIVNPILRPAGILVPAGSGVGRMQAGFGQISAQVLKVGMITEITCASKPLTVIPMVITEIQGAISTGQLRPTDQLIDLQDRLRPGTIMVTMEPVFAGHADAIPPVPNRERRETFYYSRAKRPLFKARRYLKMAAIVQLLGGPYQ